MNVDRAHRDHLVEAMDGFLHDELSAFEFDKAIFSIRDQTKDETVQHVVCRLWHHYDDCTDHKVRLDPVEWNYFQRLRLLLQSDAALESSHRRIWSAAQIVAAVALAGFAWTVSQVGWGPHLYLVALPFGAISIGLSVWRRRVYRKAMNCDVTLYPFSSVAQLLWVGQPVVGFRKERYREEIASRRVRDAGSALASALQMYVPWMLYGPAALLGQVFPMSIPRLRVAP